jgi:hypothetical protein
MSSTRRTIKLPKATAQEAYNTLSGLLHDKFSMKVNLRPRAARDSVHSLE